MFSWLGMLPYLILCSIFISTTIFGLWFTSNYYDRTFKPLLGVFPKPEPRKTSPYQWLILVLAVATYSVTLWLDTAFRLPISLTGLALSHFLVLYVLLQNRFQYYKYLLVPFTMLYLVSLLPLDGTLNDDIMRRPLTTLFVCLGLSNLLKAYFEHRLLTKARETLMQQGHTRNSRIS